MIVKIKREDSSPKPTHKECLSDKNIGRTKVTKIFGGIIMKYFFPTKIFVRLRFCPNKFCPIRYFLFHEIVRW